jgi:3-hydroxyacyl-[acyl-carrier-protein] dehydratase
MPAQEPLIDCTEFETAEIVVDPEGIGEVLRQRGTFALLDGILRYDERNDVTVGRKDIRGDDWWAPDHIPGRPLFPGALMIETGAQLASYDFIRRHGHRIGGQFIGFGGVDDCRFRGTVLPGMRMIFATRARRIRSRMFTYHVQGFVDGTVVFEADILGVVV